MQDRVPLESFRLFGFTLASHWGGGGSLAHRRCPPSAATIRDRITLTDRIQSQAMESQLSVYVVLVISYGLGFLLYKGDPERATSVPLRARVGVAMPSPAASCSRPLGCSGCSA